MFAVVQTKDADACADGLTAAGFVCTRFASQGGFLDNGNCTLMIGVDDAQVEDVIDVLRQRGRRRVELLEAALPFAGVATPMISPAVDVEVGGATVFVVPLDRLEKL
jgi:uncharacterized protein YaaQ